MPAVSEPLGRQPRVRRRRRALRQRRRRRQLQLRRLGPGREPAQPVRRPARRRRLDPGAADRRGRRAAQPGPAHDRPTRRRSTAPSSASTRRPARACPTTRSRSAPTRTPAGSSRTASATRSGSPSGRGTSEVWVGDVGWNTWEEIDRVDPTDGAVDELRLALLRGRRPPVGLRRRQPEHLREPLRGRPGRGDGARTTPRTTARTVVPGETCPTGGSSAAGIAFYDGGNYPGYAGALFFADYSRDCIWAMLAGANGLPDPLAGSPSPPERRTRSTSRSARTATSSTPTSTAARCGGSATSAPTGRRSRSRRRTRRRARHRSPSPSTGAARATPTRRHAHLRLGPRRGRPLRRLDRGAADADLHRRRHLRRAAAGDRRRGRV